MIEGGNYRTTRNEDGTITIHDVPVFCRCKRGDDDFDRDWLDRALKKAKQAERDGHLPPLEIGHRRKGHPTPPNVGAFRMKSIKSMQFKGRSEPAIMTDWIITDEYAFEQIKRKRLLYRSVDLYHKTAEIISCALLTEPPYLELPMVTVRDDANSADAAKPWEPTISEDTEVGEPVLAFQRRGELTRAFMRGPDMPTRTLSSSSYDRDASAWTFKFSDDTEEAGTGTFAEFQMVRSQFEKGEDEEERKPEDKTKMEDDAPPAEKPEETPEEELAVEDSATAKCIASIEAGDIGIDDFAAIMAAIEAKKAAIAPEEPAVDPSLESGNNPIDQLSKETDVDTAKTFAKMQAEIDANKGKLAAREQDDAVRAAVDATAEKLGDRQGFDRGAAEKFAKSHGLDAYKDYAEHLEKSLPPAATDDWERDVAQSFAGSEPEEVTKFQKDGPDKYEKAKAFAREHAELSKLPGYKLSLEDHLKTSFALASQNGKVGAA